MTLLVKLGLDSGEFNKGIEEAEAKATASSSRMVSGLSSIGGAVVTAGLAAAAAGVAGLTYELGKGIKSLMRIEMINAQTQAVIESTGGAAGLTAKEIEDMSGALENATATEAESVQQGANMLLTFTSLGKDIFPQALQATVDMARAFDKTGNPMLDMTSQAVMIGKALQDPIQGVTALRRVGVNFNEDAVNMIKTMVEMGDVAGAQKFILKELATEFGGSGEAFAKTTKGSLELVKHQFGTLTETLAGPFLSTTGGVLDKLLKFLKDVEPGVKKFGEKLAEIFTKIIDNLPKVYEAFKGAFSWLMENKGVIVGVLAAVGVAVVIFLYNAAAGAIAAAGGFAVLWASIWPVVLVLAAVGVAAYLIYQAWTNNWGGIRDTMTALWNGQLKPIFDQLIAWLQVNIPVAIQALKTFWETVLLPAIQTVWSWIQANLFPLFEKLFTWLAQNIPVALQGLKTFWENVLLPAIQKVWAWMNSTLFPFLKALADFIGAVLGLAIKALAGLWQNVLQPALEKIWAFLRDKVLPIFKDVGAWLNEKLTPAFNAISDAISKVTDWLKKMADKIKGLKLPAWLTPGSPTPFELGLRGIGDAMDDLSSRSLPDFSAELDLEPNMAKMSGISATTADNGLTINGGISVVVPQGTVNPEQYAERVIAEINKRVRQTSVSGAALAGSR
jgi:hypothetical protein